MTVKELIEKLCRDFDENDTVLIERSDGSFEKLWDVSCASNIEDLEENIYKSVTILR